jgi:hypothetical protein
MGTRPDHALLAHGDQVKVGVEGEVCWVEGLCYMEDVCSVEYGCSVRRWLWYPKMVVVSEDGCGIRRCWLCREDDVVSRKLV